MKNSNKGYTYIPNKLIEKLMKINLSPYQYRVLFCVLRKTFGWHKNEDKISLTQFEKIINIDKRHINKAIKNLEKIKILKVCRKDHINNYKLNLNFSIKNIGSGARVGTSAQNSTTQVSELAPKKVLKKVHTKKIKKTIQNKKFFPKSSEIDSVINYYCIRIKNLKVITTRRKKMVKQRLNKWTVSDLKKAIDGIANSDWHMSNKKNDFEMIFRNDEQVEKYIELYEKDNNSKGGTLPWL